MPPLIVDTDPGVDDAVALMLAAASPEADMRAVTTVFGNVALAATTANAARVLALAGRSDVPLAAGAARPLVHPRRTRARTRHGGDGLGGQAATLPPGVPPEHRGAVALIADVLRASAEPVTIASIGPLTNIALLHAVHPELADRIARIVVMGGTLRGDGTTGAAEFNVGSDPEAAQRVLTQTDVPVTLVPLEVTMRCTADRAWLAALAGAGPAGALLASMLANHRVEDAVVLHDAVAVLEAVRPGTLRTEPVPLQVVCDLGPARGVTVQAASGPTVDVAVGVTGGPAYLLDEILRRLAG